MNNLLCIFFGHKDDKVTFEKNTLRITAYDIPLTRFAMCKRCATVYLQTTWNEITVDNIFGELEKND